MMKLKFAQFDEVIFVEKIYADLLCFYTRESKRGKNYSLFFEFVFTSRNTKIFFSIFKNVDKQKNLIFNLWFNIDYYFNKILI